MVKSTATYSQNRVLLKPLEICIPYFYSCSWSSFISKYMQTFLFDFLCQFDLFILTKVSTSLHTSCITSFLHFNNISKPIINII